MSETAALPVEIALPAAAATDASTAPVGLSPAQSPIAASEWPNTAECYDLCEPIGYGAFAVVHKAKVKSGPKAGADVAVKVLELEEFQDSNLEEIRRELQMMRMCRHENLVAYHVAFPAKTRMWLVMPLLAGGSCANVMRFMSKNSGFEDGRIIAYILKETAKAIMYFHQNKQIHRDLKAGNILLSGDGKVFLSDFGVAAPLRDDKTRCTFVGTPCWMAPEVLAQTGGYDYKIDIWSFGITAIELAYGEAPYQRLHPLKVMKIILDKEPPRVDRTKFDPSFSGLIESCLQKNPARRPSMDEVMDRHTKFFDKADRQPLLEILATLPPLETRLPPKPNFCPAHAESQAADGLEGDSFDFKLDDDEKDGNDRNDSTDLGLPEDDS